MTLSQQVNILACRCISLEGTVKEILATIKLNFERGYLTTINDEGKLNLQKIIVNWEKQLELIDQTYPEQ